MRWVLGASILIGVLVLAVLSIEFQLWNPTRDTVEAKYRDTESRFTTIDGLRLHYKDQGQGPAVLLWHGNFGSLAFYDGWVERLADRYRLIRFDVNGYGLSGPDQKLDFTIERRLAIARTLLDDLEVDEYFVEGTSFAGPMAYRDAAERPDRVLGLMLANAGGLPRAPGEEINQPLPNPVMQWWRERYRTRGFWEGVVTGLHPSHPQVAPELVEQFFLMNNMKGRGPDNATGLAHFRIGDAPGYLASVTQPTLVLWGGQSILPYSEADRYEAFLNSAPLRVIKVDTLGHMFAQDDPDATAAVFDGFAQSVLAGKWPGRGCRDDEKECERSA